MPELVLILVVALLVLGPRRLPEAARALGRSLAEFRRASSELRQSLTVPPEGSPEGGSTPTQPGTADKEEASADKDRDG